MDDEKLGGANRRGFKHPAVYVCAIAWSVVVAVLPARADPLRVSSGFTYLEVLNGQDMHLRWQIDATRDLVLEISNEASGQFITHAVPSQPVHGGDLFNPSTRIDLTGAGSSVVESTLDGEFVRVTGIGHFRAQPSRWAEGPCCDQLEFLLFSTFNLSGDIRVFDLADRLLLGGPVRGAGVVSANFFNPLLLSYHFTEPGAVPEPASFLLFATGAVAVWRKRRTHN